MAINLEIIEDDESTVVEIPDSAAEVVTITETSQAVILNEDPEAVVIEALRGLPGLQNVIVSPTEPAQPEENMVWIDIS